MSDRFHAGTFIWGALLTLAGAALSAVGFGWWDVSTLDLRFVAPVLVVLIGVTLLAGALAPRRDTPAGDDRN